jgi:PKD repeat protein
MRPGKWCWSVWFGVVLVLVNCSFYVQSNINDIEIYSDSPSDQNFVVEGIEDESRISSAQLGDEPVTFTNVTNLVGLNDVNGNYFSWTDYNNDGNFDVLINGRRLFRNDGAPDYNFTEVTSPANITGGTWNGVWGDYDNDGYLDLYAGAGTNGIDKLWHNNDDGTFTDVTQSAGGVTDAFNTAAAGWGDFDKDGDLDLYVANGENWNSGNPIYYPDKFYLNNGNGTFTDITVAAGIDDYTSPYYGRGVAWGDYDNDGWLDIYISNYRIQHNYLWRNNHDGTFTDVSFDENVTGLVHYYGTQGPYYGHTIGSSWGDLNNDGNLDIWASNLVHKYVDSGDIRGYICDDSNIFLSQGAPHYNFKDIRGTSGIPTKPIGGSGTYIGDELWFNAAIADFDNDGDLDVYVPQAGGEGYNFTYSFSFLFRNNNDGTFTDIGVTAGLRTWCTYGGAWADYNNDGFLDLITSGKVPQNGGDYEVKLYKNNGNSNNWLQVQVVGNESNKVGIGTRVKIETTAGSQIREVEGGSGCHSHQNSLPVEFGLGSTTKIDELVVRWPSGKLQKMNNINANQMIQIYENMTAPVISSITMNRTNMNEDETITFNAVASDPDGSITSYNWDFDGDGIYDWTSATSPGLVTHAYTEAGVFNGRLTVWDDSGVLGAFDSTEYFTVNNVPPMARAGEDKTVWEDDFITFDGSDSFDTPSDNANLIFNWTFGDGEYSGWNTTSTAQYNYTNRGDYTVTLKVRDDDNVTVTDSIQVEVKNKPPSCSIISEDIVNEDEEIVFTIELNDTYSDLPTLIYILDFGDGNNTFWSTEFVISHSYTTNGIYTVRCVVRDDDGIQFENSTEKIVLVLNNAPKCFVEEDKTVLEDQIVYLNGTGNDTLHDRPLLRYMWYFGDGSTSDWLIPGEQNITHVYADEGVYKATLVVNDTDILTSNSLYINVLNLKPTCIALDDMEISEDDTVEFIGTGRDTKSDKDSLLYSWSLGIPGVPETPWDLSPEFSFKYLDSGEYTAVLTVKDDNGAMGNASFKIRVLNIIPTAKFLTSSGTVNEGEMVTFDASESSDTMSDLPNLNYSWSFDDNSPTKFGIVQEHIYNKSGKYRISLMVTDDNGESESYKKTVEVKNMKPTASLSVSKNIVYVGDEIFFSASASSDSPSDISTLTFDWDFGDRKQGNGETIYHSYDGAGRYTVVLRVTDDDGSFSDDEITITVNDVTSGESEVSSEKDNEYWMYGAALVIVLLIILLLLLIFYLKKPKRTEEEVDSIEGEPPKDLKAEYLPPGLMKIDEKQDESKAITSQEKTPTEDTKGEIVTGPDKSQPKKKQLKKKKHRTLGSKYHAPRLPKESIVPELDEEKTDGIEKDEKEPETEMESEDETKELEDPGESTKSDTEDDKEDEVNVDYPYDDDLD